MPEPVAAHAVERPVLAQREDADVEPAQQVIVAGTHRERIVALLERLAHDLDRDGRVRGVEVLERLGVRDHGVHLAGDGGVGLTFQRAADLPLTPIRNRWFGNLVSDGRTLSFFGTGPGPWPMTSADGFTWNAAPDAVRVPGIDPAVLALRDGARLVLSTKAPSAAPTGYPATTPAP